MGGLLSPEPVLYEGRCSNRWTGRGLGWSRGRRPAKGSREARLRNAGRPCVCSNPRSCHRASDPRECESCVLSVCSPPGGDASPLHHQQGHGSGGKTPGPRAQPGILKGAHSCASMWVSIGVTSGPWTTRNRSRTPITSFARKMVGSDANCCSCSLTKSCLTPRNPRNCSTPGFPVRHHLLEFA